LRRDKQRLRAELFLELPDRELYADYYEVVAAPISMQMILREAESGGYADSASFMAAWQLLNDNAHAYNP
jgi:ATP-dependent helicase STH1/SNF2